MDAALRREVRRQLDREFARLNDLGVTSPPRRGWIHAVRTALGMTERQLAERLGVSQSSVHRLEASEADGVIRLDTLRRAAEALGCRVVYAVVPDVPLEETVTARAEAVARSELERVAQTMRLEDQGVTVSPGRLAERAREIIERGDLWRATP